MPIRENKTSSRPSIFELATMYNEEENPRRRVQGTKVVVNTNRLHYGNDATISAFLATAYDKKGNAIDSIEGYFLEPNTDYELATTENSDTAVMPGTYSIVPKWSSRQKYKWYLKDVEGRTGIAIHGGESGRNTTGCLIPGRAYRESVNREGNSYIVSGAKEKTKELFEFFETYGNGDIKINICMPD